MKARKNITHWFSLLAGVIRVLPSLTMLLLAHTSHAQDIYMNPGATQNIQVKEDIDTVFISAPDVVDYEVLGERGLIIYARDSGRAELVVLDKEGEQIMKATLVVDALLSEIQKHIAEIAPDSQVSIQKIAQSYVISGIVATEEDRDKVYQIVGEGLGAQQQITQKEVADVGGGEQQGGSSLNEVVYKGVINKLQLPTTNQVNVKLSVVEVTKDFTDNVGVDWGTIGSATGTFRFVKFDADTLTSLVHAVSNDSVARVLAEPNLSVLSGETAEFLVGGEIPVVTSSNNNGTNVQYKEFGIKLSVGAKVSSSKRIRIILGEEVSNVDSTFNTTGGDSFPTFQTRRARTTVELADGESFLLGGLISSNEREALSKVPFIGDVPILGALFRNASTSRNRRELMVVATVNLVKPIGGRAVVMPDFQRTSTWARFFNFDGISNLRDRQRAKEFVEQGGFIK